MQSLAQKPVTYSGDGLEFLHRVFAGVIDDVARVVPHLEIGTVDPPQAALDFLRGPAAAAVGFEDQFHFRLLRVIRRVGHHLVILLVVLLFIHAESQQPFQIEELRMIDLPPHIPDRTFQRQLGLDVQCAHGRREAGTGNSLFQACQILVRGLRADERFIRHGSQQAHCPITRLLDPLERDIETPVGRLRRVQRLHI